MAEEEGSIPEGSEEEEEGSEMEEEEHMEDDVKRLPSLHNPNLDVDPDLVVHRFSKNGHEEMSPEFSPDYSPEDPHPNGEHDEDETEAHGEDLDSEGQWRSSNGGTGEYLSGSGFWKEIYGEDDDDEMGLNHDENDEDTLNRSDTQNGDSLDTTPTNSSEKKIKELTKASFRWFERKILALQVPKSDEESRRKELLEKCQLLRKVSKPVVTIFGGKNTLAPTADDAKNTDSIRALQTLNSKMDLKGVTNDGEEEFDGEGEDEEEEEEEEGEDDAMSLPKYTAKEWAMKHTVEFLETAACTSTTSRSYPAKLKSIKEEAYDYRLALYERQLKRRRMAIGSHMAAPEITAAFRRAAERSVWRAVIDSTKPRYPLPRFILPRHLYLRKVQRDFLGPGSYDPDVYEIMRKARLARLPSSIAGCSSRFPKEDADKAAEAANAGASVLDAWPILDAANYKKKHPGTGIPFESTPCNYRGLALRSNPDSGIPPNAYNIKSPMEEYIKKVTSLRGPYDCYTPSRSIIPYGYYMSTESSKEKCRLGPGSYEIRSSTVKMQNDAYNRFKGVFAKADRDDIFGFKAAFDSPLWPRKGVVIPPVGQYEVGRDAIGSDRKQRIAPFLNGFDKNKEFTKPELVAPDYYYYASGATWTVPPAGASLASAFRSKTPQILTERMFKIRKVRNKAVNRNVDMEGGGHHDEVHWAFDKSYKHDYALEDCPTRCTGLQKTYKAVPTGNPPTGKCCGN